ncbi:MAG: hypothetical protein RIE86_25960, partial [Imperialibacter sp.]|uniref:hypothetical protein n=1 Tax=Imperialibacter sp. TaxID=2038411 RepID=UPI0032EB808A
LFTFHQENVIGNQGKEVALSTSRRAPSLLFTRKSLSVARVKRSLYPPTQERSLYFSPGKRHR